MMRVTLALVFCATPVLADGFCNALDQLPQTQTLAIPMAPEVICAKGQALGGASFTHCGWPFEFRSAEATAAFAALHSTLLACTGVIARSFEDQLVNHPDSYDLRFFDRGNTEIAISIKDKGALQKTYIFLRTQTP